MNKLEKLEIAESEQFIEYNIRYSKYWQTLLEKQITVEKQARSLISVLLSNFNKRSLILENGYLKYGNIDAKAQPKYEIHISKLIDDVCEFQIEKAPYRSQNSRGYYLGRSTNQDINFKLSFTFRRKHMRFFKKNQSIQGSFLLAEKDEVNLECWVFKGKLDQEQREVVSKYIDLLIDKKVQRQPSPIPPSSKPQTAIPYYLIKQYDNLNIINLNEPYLLVNLNALIQHQKNIILQSPLVICLNTFNAYQISLIINTQKVQERILLINLKLFEQQQNISLENLGFTNQSIIDVSLNQFCLVDEQSYSQEQSSLQIQSQSKKNISKNSYKKEKVNNQQSSHLLNTNSLNDQSYNNKNTKQQVNTQSQNNTVFNTNSFTGPNDGNQVDTKSQTNTVLNTKSFTGPNDGNQVDTKSQTNTVLNTKSFTGPNDGNQVDTKSQTNTVFNTKSFTGPNDGNQVDTKSQTNTVLNTKSFTGPNDGNQVDTKSQTNTVLNTKSFTGPNDGNQVDTKSQTNTVLNTKSFTGPNDGNQVDTKSQTNTVFNTKSLKGPNDGNQVDTKSQTNTVLNTNGLNGPNDGNQVDTKSQTNTVFNTKGFNGPKDGNQVNTESQTNTVFNTKSFNGLKDGNQVNTESQTNTVLNTNGLNGPNDGNQVDTKSQTNTVFNTKGFNGPKDGNQVNTESQTNTVFNTKGFNGPKDGNQVNTESQTNTVFNTKSFNGPKDGNQVNTESQTNTVLNTNDFYGPKDKTQVNNFYSNSKGQLPNQNNQVESKATHLNQCQNNQFYQQQSTTTQLKSILLHRVSKNYQDLIQTKQDQINLQFINKEQIFQKIDIQKSTTENVESLFTAFSLDLTSLNYSERQQIQKYEFFTNICSIILTENSISPLQNSLFLQGFQNAYKKPQTS